MGNEQPSTLKGEGSETIPCCEGVHYYPNQIILEMVDFFSIFVNVLIKIKMTKIYKLLDPDTMEIRYIGKTIQPLWKRLSAHIVKAKRNRTSHISCWIHSLVEQGKRPVIQLIEETDNWIEREQFYISQYPNLCNHSIGGESGTLGYIMSAEHKLKISNSLKGISRPLDVRSKISSSHKNKVLSEVTKEKLRIVNLGKQQSVSSRIKRTKGSIMQFDLDGNIIKEWYSLGQIQQETGFLKANISSCCHNRLKTAYGFKWSFKEEDIVQS